MGWSGWKQSLNGREESLYRSGAGEPQEESPSPSLQADVDWASSTGNMAPCQPCPWQGGGGKASLPQVQ